jgi:hypothetical protein
MHMQAAMSDTRQKNIIVTRTWLIVQNTHTPHRTQDGTYDLQLKETINTQIHPTADTPLMRASTIFRSLGSAFASRNTRNSRNNRKITTGKEFSTKLSGDIST